MATNVSPQYDKAHDRLRAAATDEERLAALQEMLSTVPKHKASEKLQADLKTRISVLRKSLAAKPPAAAGKGVDLFHVPKGGCGQVVLVGPPNSGKSALVAATTSAPVKVAPYPYTTVAPVPGMWAWEDVQIQLVDAPPMTAEHVPGGLLGTIRSADVVVVVVDAAGDLLEETEATLKLLSERGIALASTPRAQLRGQDDGDGLSLPDDESEPQPSGAAQNAAGVSVASSEVRVPSSEFRPAKSEPSDKATASPPASASRLYLMPAVIVANKVDQPGAADNVEVLREIYAGGAAGPKLDVLAVSAEAKTGLNELGRRIWELLAVIRIYTKQPGKPADKERPYTLPIDSSVDDLCRAIHQDLPAKFKFARIWGDGRFSGAQVHRTEILRDKDVVEVHQ